MLTVEKLVLKTGIQFERIFKAVCMEDAVKILEHQVIHIMICDIEMPGGSGHELLNLFYSNQEIADLLCYGIEGVHYEKTEDGHFTYAKGRTDNPFLNNRGNMPNQFIAHVWEGEELDYWQQIAEQNETAVQSERSGFNFDYSKVEAEHREVVNIYNLYKKILNNGLDNQEECRERMLKEMEESGLRLLLKEEQTQYEAWKRRKL